MAKRRRVRLKTPPLLFEKTQSVLRRIRPRVEGSFLTYWTSTSGSVCDNDVMAMHDILRARGKQDTITLFLKSDGGSGMTSLRMVHLLRRYTKRLVVLAPLNCASAATMLALGADAIALGPLSYLTAVDTSLEHDLSPLDHTNQLVAVSNDEVDRVIRLWKEAAGSPPPARAAKSVRRLAKALRIRRAPAIGTIPMGAPGDASLKSGSDGAASADSVNPYQELYKYLHPLVIGSLDRASSLSLMLCREILGYHMKDTEKAERISRQLNSSYPAHQYPITSREAKRIGLNVVDLDPEVDLLLQELNLLYSEMGQRAITDYDEWNNHDNEITNILEGDALQMFYQVEKDWHYRKEERRFVPMNDVSGWYRCRKVKGRVVKQKFHIR
jgi:hypothetical protein